MESKNVGIEYSPEYIKKMQQEGMFDAMAKIQPEYPDCEIYMEAYYKTLRS